MFGNTGLKVSEVGFGAWAIGGNAMVGDTPIGWGPADDEVSIAAIRASLDRGINFFDTADFYGLGHSEELLGRELKGKKDVVIATKVGHREINGKIVLDYSKEYILAAVEHSLKRLQREVIDYYQLHSARLTHLQDGGCIEAMQLLQAQGKIRYWGLSLNTFEPEPEAAYLLQHGLGSGWQLVFNLINQKAFPLLSMAASGGYGIIARMPLQFGLLTGKFNRNTSFGKDDHRSFRLNREILDNALDILEQRIWPLCEKYQTSRTGLAMSFILSFPEVSTVIPGIRTAAHAVDNTSGIVRLEETDRKMLQELYATQWQPVVEAMKALG